jgi:hypothetical protein
MDMVYQVATSNTHRVSFFLQAMHVGLLPFFCVLFRVVWEP